MRIQCFVVLPLSIQRENRPMRVPLRLIKSVLITDTGIPVILSDSTMSASLALITACL